MTFSRPKRVDFRDRRRWCFADCVFDEANWALIVGGSRVAIEAKPLELLSVLLRNAGSLVTKDELLDAIWPDVAVVEASIPTAVGKLRRALHDDRPGNPIIETVPRIGYRLAVPIEFQDVSAVPPDVSTARQPTSADEPRPTIAVAATADRKGPKTPPGLLLLAGTLAMAAAAIAFVQIPPQNISQGKTAQSFTQRDALNALRKLDVGTVEYMLAAGWDPNTPFDKEGNGALNMVLNICEWDRRHDQSQLLLTVRTLIDGGAQVDQRNVWGDTAYSIAKAQRYCGPNHPVTNSIRTICYAGYKPRGDRCLASYELARRA